MEAGEAEFEITRSTLREVSALLHHHHHRDAHAWMQKIKQEIFSIDVVDVAVVGVSPTLRPRIDELKSVAAVLKLWLT